jgi:hypothetical protein
MGGVVKAGVVMLEVEMRGPRDKASCVVGERAAMECELKRRSCLSVWERVVNVQGHILLRRTRPNRTGMACGRTVWPSEEGGVRARHEGKHVQCLLAIIALFLLFVLFFLGHVTGYG